MRETYAAAAQRLQLTPGQVAAVDRVWQRTFRINEQLNTSISNEEVINQSIRRDMLMRMQPGQHEVSFRVPEIIRAMESSAAVLAACADAVSLYNPLRLCDNLLNILSRLFSVETMLP